MVSYIHKPVFGNKIISYLDVKENQILLDCTCGEGGHGEIFLTAFKEQFHYIGLDRDSQILEIAKNRLLPLSNKSDFFHTSYAYAKDVLKTAKINQVDRILIDLGISMFQIHQTDRGFSFNTEDRLDMRFDQQKKGISAYDIVNSYDEEEISDIIYIYGEEKASRKIARNIVSERTRRKILTCTDLARIISKTKGFSGKIHPATQTFQALRIYVNSEFHELELLCQDIPELLTDGGKIAFITYHSLEDRIVKTFMRNTHGIQPVNKKVILPDEEETQSNPASRSAKLRVGQKYNASF